MQSSSSCSSGSFEEDATHGFIQIHASNAFNSINRTLLLHNVKTLCLEIATCINNCYMKPSKLFITGGKEISSNKGSTQVDPMGIYALGLMPMLTSIISNNTRNLIHVVFADYLTDVGKIYELIEWWKNVLHCGPWLLRKPIKIMVNNNEEYIEIVNETFRDYNIKMTTTGHRHLGAVIGLIENKEEFVIAKVSE